MHYALSDLHGRYDLYRAMLDKIKLDQSDTLYILGDFVDRGDEGLKIVLDVAERNNVVPIMGNHDLTAQIVLSQLDRELSADEICELRRSLNLWMMDGGEPTLKEFRDLSASDKRLALGVIDTFRNYSTLDVGNMKYIMCHAGIAGFTLEKPLASYTIMDYAFVREDYSKPKIGSPNIRLVTGHTPTVAIEGAEKGRIFHSHDHIAVDCGAVFDMGLGCICLETMEEFYVK